MRGRLARHEDAIKLSGEVNELSVNLLLNNTFGDEPPIEQ